MNDITRALGATQLVCLVQSRHRTLAGQSVLRVEVENAQMPTLHQVQVGEGVTMAGAKLPSRSYIAHLGLGWALKIKPCTAGVRVELIDVRLKGAPMRADVAWRWATARLVVELPWWTAVQACEWDAGEAGEVAA